MMPSTGKDAVRGNQLHARSGGVRFLELGFQVCHVVVGITEALGFAEAHAVNNGSVVQGIGNNSVVCSQEAFKQPAVGVKAGGKQNRVFRAEKLGKTFFQFDTGEGLCVPQIKRTDAMPKPHWSMALVAASLSLPDY